MSEEFYIGYLPKAPTMLSVWLRRIALGLAAMSALIALLLVFAQQPFAAGTFEFGKTREFEGTILEMPFPRLGPYLLAGQGKHGVQEMFQGREGLAARLQGSLIHRDGMQMVEVDPASLAFGRPSGVRIAREDLGEVRLRGEIVDAKCFMGVMNPGSGHVHRDCAVRCLLGRLPAMFVSDGKKMLLEGFNVRRNVERVGVPVELTGRLRKEGEWLVLRITGL